MSSTTTFWEKWYKADELERVKLVRTLTLPSPRVKPKVLYENHAAGLINSYLEDLVEYLMEGTMNKRNYKELWEQLKVLILCGSKVRYNKKELYQVMSDLELMQLAQDPLAELTKLSKELTK